MLIRKIISYITKLLLLPMHIVIIPLGIIAWFVKRILIHADAIEAYIQRLERGIRRK